MRLYTLLLIFVLLLTTVFASEISVDLEYLSGTQWDSNDDGIVNLNGVIDFTVQSTQFDFDVNTEELITRWGIYSEDTDQSTILCFGSVSNCEKFGQNSVRDNWDDPFEIYYGYQGAGESNLVGAQVRSVDLSSSPITIITSDWELLPAIFTSGVSSTSAEFSVTSPDNSSSITSGENVLLSFSSSQTIDAKYSFDGGNFIELGSDTIFNSLLDGSLAHGVVSNGDHTIKISAIGSNQSTNYTHNFEVLDNNAPLLTTNLSNGSLYGTTGIVHISVQTDEYATLNVQETDLDIVPDTPYALPLVLLEGINNLTLTVSDYQGNSNAMSYFVNYSLVGTCTDGVMNNNETSIDCGGDCLACIPFNLSVPELSYNTNDQVYVSVTARANSTVPLTVTRDGTLVYSYTFIPVFDGAPISETRLIENTDIAGLYQVSASVNYMGNIEQKSALFNVVEVDTLSVSIKANETTIDEGGSITYNASVSDSTGSVSYAWDFNGDGSVESSAKTVERTYETNGTYVVNLTVTDDLTSVHTQKTVTVRKLYDVKVRVLSNESHSAIEGAEIRYNGVEKNSSSDGQATFTVNPGTFTLRVEKDSYKTFSNSSKIKNDTTLTVYLLSRDEIAPQITLLTPSDGASLTNPNITFTFATIDTTQLICRLYINDKGSAWVRHATNNSVPPNIQSQLKANNLRNSNFDWRIECIDRDGNTANSGTRSFSVTRAIEVQQDEVSDEITDEVLIDIDSVISNIKNLRGPEKEAAAALNLIERVDKYKLDIQRANRDLHNLKWRRLNGTDEDEVRQEILDRIEVVRSSLPVALTVKDTTEFVTFPRKSDVRKAAEMYFEYSNTKATNRQVTDYLDLVNELQDKLTITTKVKIIDLEYVNGEQETITLIEKEIVGADKLNDVTLYEVIPKEVSEKVDDITFLFDFDIIEEDPVIEIDISKIPVFAYYVVGRRSFSDIERVQSVLLSTEPVLASKNFLTGFAVFDSLNTQFMHSSQARLIVEIIIIIILVAIYFVYSMGGFTQVLHLNKRSGEIEELIKNAHTAIGVNKYDEATTLYRTIGSKFKEVPEKKKPDIKLKVTELASAINVVFIKQLVEKAEKHIDAKKKDEALAEYEKMRSLYEKISKDQKKTVSDACIKIHAKLGKL